MLLPHPATSEDQPEPEPDVAGHWKGDDVNIAALQPALACFTHAVRVWLQTITSSLTVNAGLRL